MVELSWALLAEGETQAIIRVRLAPPSESFSSLVSTESRYGMYSFRFFESPRAEMHLPSASSELG